MSGRSSATAQPIERCDAFWRAICGGVLGAVLLCGCASYHPQPLHPRDSASDFAARSLDDPRLARRARALLPRLHGWPPTRWTRAELLAVALAESPELAAIRAAVATQRAAEITAGQTPNPRIGMAAEYALDDTKPWLYGLSFDLPLRSPQRRRLAVQLAGIRTSGARWRLMQATWSVRQQLTVALSDWRAADADLQWLQRLTSDRKALIEQAQKRIHAGQQAADSIVALRQQQLQAEEALTQQTLRRAAARARAAAVLGMPTRALDAMVYDWPKWGRPPPLERSTFVEARNQALLTRADLAAAINAYAATEMELRQAVARQYPQFDLMPGYYWDHGVKKFPLGVRFTLPVFNQNQGEIAEKRAARTEAADRMLALQATIYGQIDAARDAEFIARRNRALANRRRDVAERQLRLARLKERLGAADSTAVLTAAVTRDQAALEASDAAAVLQTRRNALEDALQKPLSGSETKMLNPSARRPRRAP